MDIDQHLNLSFKSLREKAFNNIYLVYFTNMVRAWFVNYLCRKVTLGLVFYLLALLSIFYIKKFEESKMYCFWFRVDARGNKCQGWVLANDLRWSHEVMAFASWYCYEKRCDMIDMCLRSCFCGTCN